MVNLLGERWMLLEQRRNYIWHVSVINKLLPTKACKVRLVHLFDGTKESNMFVRFPTVTWKTSKITVILYGSVYITPLSTAVNVLYMHIYDVLWWTLFFKLWLYKEEERITINTLGSSFFLMLLMKYIIVRMYLIIFRQYLKVIAIKSRLIFRDFNREMTLIIMTCMCITFHSSPEEQHGTRDQRLCPCQSWAE